MEFAAADDEWWLGHGRRHVRRLVPLPAGQPGVDDDGVGDLVDQRPEVDRLEWEGDGHGKLIHRPGIPASLGFFASLAAISGFLAFVVAFVPIAFWLRFVARRSRLAVLFLITASMFASYLVRIYAWRTVLGSRGLINSALERIGLIDQPLGFLLYSRFAVIVPPVAAIASRAFAARFSSALSNWLASSVACKGSGEGSARSGRGRAGGIR